MKLPYLMPEEAKARQCELLREAQADQRSQKMRRNRSNLLRRSSDFLMAVGQKLTRQRQEEYRKFATSILRDT